MIRLFCNADQQRHDLMTASIWKGLALPVYRELMCGSAGHTRSSFNREHTL